MSNNKKSIKDNKKKLTNKIILDKKSSESTDITSDELHSESTDNMTSDGGSILDLSISTDSIIIPKYIPETINIPTTIKNILEYEADINVSLNIDYPKFSQGFNHYIHAGKKKIDIFKEFENKKKIYDVINEFVPYIDNYEESIGDIARKYFKIEIKSEEFYKMWEILLMFNIIDINNDKFTSGHIGESGSFLQTIILYRDMYTKNTKNDKYYIIQTSENNILNNDLINYYKKEKPQQIIDTNENISIKLDLITTYNDIEKYNNNITNEQEINKILLKELIFVMKMQKKGGVFICKIYETYTITSYKIIVILASLYNKIFFVKPLMSKYHSSEKYIVCIDFKYSDSDNQLKNIIKNFSSLLKQLNTTTLHIVDIFTSYEISLDILSHIIQFNNVISNKQFKNINQIIKFINDQNYYGDIYQKKRNLQIESTKYWTDLFLFDPKIYKEQKSKIVDTSFISNKINVDKSIELFKQLK